MKISISTTSLALALTASGVCAFQPTLIPSSAFRRSPDTALLAVKQHGPPGDDGRIGRMSSTLAAATASGVAAWTLASQVAFAGMMLPSETVAVDAPSFNQQSSSSVVVAVETMDFSMPSYSDAVTGSTKATSKASEGAPAFNPFGDFKPDFLNKGDDSPAPSAPSPAPMEMPKMPEFKVPELKAPEIKAPAIKAPDMDIPEFKAPDIKVPDIKVPDFKAPDIDIPDFKAPDIKIPEFKAPDVKIPDFKAPSFSMPKFDLPKMESSGGGYDLDLPKTPKVDLKAPDIKIPEFKAPDVKIPDFKAPSFSMPKFDLPKMESSGGGYNLDLPKTPKVDLPKVDMPKVDLPKVDMPEMPKLPAISNPFGGGGGGGSSGSSSDARLEPREVRDEKAREARKVFLAADEDAKVVEQQAREVRALANQKKKLANEAKDLACADRLGGKWICLRNPFNSGF